jgi:hypothetical protein
LATLKIRYFSKRRGGIRLIVNYEKFLISQRKFPIYARDEGGEEILRRNLPLILAYSVHFLQINF